MELSYIQKPDILLDQIWKDKNIHIVQKQRKLGRDYFKLIDISLKAHGKDEDQQYIKSKFYRDNIRRGNTLIEDSKGNIRWGRKGTPKTLDIQLEYLQSYYKNIDLSKKQKTVRDVIFQSNVSKSLEKGKKVQLIKTEKANGQNAQVSYNYDYNAWLICSKNVSIMAKDRSDLKSYQDQRYTYALLIAQTWFDLIEPLTGDQKLKIKELLDGFTIIGQYCGNPLYQHLVRYDKIHLRWFALVDNFSNQFCVDPFQARKQFIEFGFIFVKIKNIGTFSNIKGFMESLSQLYTKTAQAGLEDEQFGMQGSIVYFVELDMVDKKAVSTPIGAAKLKTLEYRFFRKIRQKLSRFRQRRESQIQLIRKFQNECEQLQNVNRSKAPFPIDYYKKVLKTGFEILKRADISDDFLRGRFIAIIKLIFYINQKKISIQNHLNSMLSDDKFLDKVTDIELVKYGAFGCESKIIYIIHGLPGMFKTYLGKKIQPHFAKLKLNYKLISQERQNFENKTHKQQQFQKVLQIISQSINEDKNQLKQSENKNKTGSLNHYYIDGCFSPQQLGKIIQKIKNQGKKNIFKKFILIKDEVKTSFEQGYNQYPFNIETILMAYHGVYKKNEKLSTIKEKIEKLKIVTESLKKNVNFDEKKLGTQIYQYPFSKNTKIKEQQEISSILLGILESEENESFYQRLLLRLQKIQDIHYLNDQEINDEIQHLIRSSYPSIQRINFKFR